MCAIRNRAERLQPEVSQMTDVPPTAPRAKRHLRVVPQPTGQERDKREADTGQEQGAESPQKRKTKTRTSADPITGLTQKQEAFVQGVMRGLSLSDAYREAYVVDQMAPATIHTRACELLQDSKIRGRCEAIAAERERERRMLASSDAALALKTLRELAEKADSDSARIRAAELLAKAGGVFIERVEVEDKTPASSTDLERRIAERLGRLGIAV
jgi:hypothetical protein